MSRVVEEPLEGQMLLYLICVEYKIVSHWIKKLTWASSDEIYEVLYSTTNCVFEIILVVSTGENIERYITYKFYQENFYNNVYCKKY